MAQNSNEHLSITQLSAYVDKELASDELALCDAHLSNCQNCQAMLADLRQTAVLTRRLPQIEVPRSFALPLNLATLPSTPESEPVRQVRNGHRTRWRNVLRPLSTIAAILGVLFILVGAFSALSVNFRSTPTSSVSTTGNSAAPQYAITRTANSTGQAPDVKSPAASATPAFVPQTPSAHENQGQDLSLTSAHATLPAFLDPGKPEGRLSIGTLLFFLGILGLFLTRRITK